ncbi:MAG TPA: sugar ABC transporter ATP-binding protein, partial [Tepidisphaeraceae bacterium]|nr:sugar ABC transporter ATP-binding protein [Tepidisphaeraceae bacterium]
ILDEPTSSLDANEVQRLFAVMQKLRDEGMAIIFVSHFLDQIYAVTDRITILRNGRLIGEYPTSQLSRQDLIARMMGRELADLDVQLQREKAGEHAARQSSNVQNNIGGQPLIPSPGTPGEGQGGGSLSPPGQSSTPSPALPRTTGGGSKKSSQDLSGAQSLLRARGLGRVGSIRPFNLEIGAGEVIGLAGLLGSGRSELARLMFGIDVADTGDIEIAGRKMVFRQPRQAVAMGMAFCPEDRKTSGIIPELSIRENIVLALQARGGLFKSLSRARQDEIANGYIKAIGIVTPSAEQSIANLSGGNQQKAILARWLAADPRLLILDEPTRGIDVGAKAEIQKLVLSLCRQGTAIVFISSELEEVVRVSDRVLVLRDRALVGQLRGAAISEQAIMQKIAQDRPAEVAQ